MSFGYGPARRLLGGGDPEAEGAAQASMAMQPNVLGYAQDVLSGKYAREGVLGQSRPYDPALSYRQNVPDTRASLDPAIDVAMGIGPGAIRAFHGSPYDFARFDMSKIGTGEGAQAYGHGLYFAEAEDVARSYKNKLANQDMTVPMSLDGTPVSGRNWVQQQNAMWDKGDKQGAYLAQMLGDANRYNVRTMGALKKLYEAPYGPDLPWDNPFGDIGSAFRALRSRASFAPQRGRMYEVNIDADPQRLLDWDKPLRRQSPEVQEYLRSQGVPEQTTNYYAGPNPRPTTGEEAYRALIDRISPTGLSRLNAPPRVSEQLNEAGIPGIRYLDQGSRGAGTGSSNYVVFDPKRIEILRKYGILGPLAGAGAMALPGEDGGGL